MKIPTFGKIFLAELNISEAGMKLEKFLTLKICDFLVVSKDKTNFYLFTCPEI